MTTAIMVPGAAFGMGYLRGRFGEKADIWGVPIDLGASLLLHGLSLLLGFGAKASRTVQMVTNTLRDVGNGALAAWATSMGAALGAKKRAANPKLATAPAANPQPAAAVVGAGIEALGVSRASATSQSPAMPNRPREATHAVGGIEALAASRTPVTPQSGPMPNWPREAARAAPSAAKDKPRRSNYGAHAVARREAEAATPPMPELPSLEESMQGLPRLNSNPMTIEELFAIVSRTAFAT